MKRARRIFFAIPFDAATTSMYERIASTVREQFPSVTTIIGTSQVGPSPKYSTYASFRTQNRKLDELFVDQIKSADVVVADLTHNNPNVHVELGIALQNNKNVLRVTGRQLIELGFDIRNLEVHAYKDEKALTDRITEYLSMFFEMKQLSMSPEHEGLYHRVDLTVRLAANRINGFAHHPLSPPGVVLRDGAVQVEFEINEVQSEQDWFGILFRSGGEPLLGSHMLYIRRSGAVELALYPGPKTIAGFQGAPIIDRSTAVIEFENDELAVRVRGSSAVIRPLTNEAAGSVWLAAWQANVTVYKAEMIARDTIEWNRSTDEDDGHSA